MTNIKNIEAFARYYSFCNLNKWWIIPCVILAVSVVFFPLKGVAPSSDSTWYLNKALGMYQEFDFDQLLTRRPVFPLFMSFSFQLFGVAFESGFHVVRLFYVLNIMLCYFLGRRLFNIESGISVALLLLTSYTINLASSHLLLDSVILFFLLFYMLLIQIAFEKSSYRYFMLAGFVLSAALLTKGVFAILFIPLPLLLFAYSQYRCKKNVTGVFLLYASFISVLTPWIYYLLIGKIKLKILVGPLGDIDKMRNKGHIPFANQALSARILFDFVVRKWNNLNLFTQNYIDKLFVLSSLFYVGPLYSLYQTIIKKKSAHLLLIGGIFCFSPIVHVVSNAKGHGFRDGQLLFLWVILYLMLSAFIFDIAKLIANKISSKFKIPSHKNYYYLAISSITVIACLYFQIFVGTIDNNRKKFYNLMACKKVGRNYCFSFYGGNFKVGGWGNAEVRETSKWMLDNLKFESTILCQPQYRESFRFLTLKHFNIKKLRNFRLYNINLDKDPQSKLGKPLFIRPKKKQIDGYNYLTGQFENHFLKQIIYSNADYIIITQRMNFLSLYLDHNPNFTLLQSFGDGKIKIFAVNTLPVQPHINFKTKFGKNTHAYLNYLYKNKRKQYDKEKNVIGAILNWDDTEKQKFFSFIESGDAAAFWEVYEKIENGKVY